MQALTPAGETILHDIARRYNLSDASAVSMLVAVHRGGGGMAQFHCPELGGGQWMRGGMTMVGDMFNHGLKATVNNLCNELSDALANNQMFPVAPQGGGAGGGGGAAGGYGNWWPGDFGAPSSSGSQNHIRYAFFPQAQRLVVERDGQVSVFNTLDHRIGGVSQQQSGTSSLIFTSQYGTVSTLSLPLISGPGLEGTADPTNFAAAPARNPAIPALSDYGSPSQPSPSAGRTSGQQSQQNPASPQGGHEIVSLLEKLGQLRDAGVLTDEEFASKKAELLGRV